MKRIYQLFYLFLIWNKNTRCCLEDVRLWEAFVWKQRHFSPALPLHNHMSVKLKMLQTALHLVNNPLKNLPRKQAATGCTYPAPFQQELRWFSSLTAQVCNTSCSLRHLKFSLYRFACTWPEYNIKAGPKMPLCILLHHLLKRSSLLCSRF